MPEEEKEDLMPRGLTSKNTEVIRATHRKIIVPSTDTGTYDFTTPSITPDTADAAVSIPDLEELFWKNPIVNKALVLKANRVIGDGFELVPSDEIGANEEVAKAAIKECWKFLKKINYVSFFRQSVINAYVAGNEWTELVYNKLNSLIYISHGDFRTLDFQRDYISNKILLDERGEPVGFWQYIENLSDLYHSLSVMYGHIDSYKNMLTSKERLEESQTHEIKDKEGNVYGAIMRKPNYMFIRKKEISHLSFNNLNDNFWGTSAILPAYDSIIHLQNVMFATAEAINDMGYPKPVMKVGNEGHPPTEKLNDQAEDAIQDPKRKEGFVIPYFMDLSYLQSQIQNSITEYPEWFITSVSIGLRVPRELLTGEGEANRATAVQASSDFEKDIEADRRQLEDYIYTILSQYLDSRGYKNTAGDRSIYIPTIKWPKFITEDEALREKMVHEKWEKGALTFNQYLQMLKLNEIEDKERGEKYFDEINAPKQEGGIGVGDLSKMTTRATTFQAQHALENKKKLNPALNKEFKTKDVDYKKIATKDVGKKIKSVSKNKAKLIRDAIVNGEAKKKSAKAIFEEVKKIGNYTDAETKRVLITEQKNLKEQGDLQSAKNKKQKFKKWKSIIDEVTHPICRALNGKKIPIDEDFKVNYVESGKRKTWSGSAPSAHANCRSSLEFS